MNSKRPLNYQASGVDIEEGQRLVELIKPLATKTRIPGVLNGIGGFGAAFEIPVQNYQNPVLISSTDGVGTKLKLAQMLGRHDTIGIDLVAMCVNDILTSGAKPLFFLDYYATSHLHATSAAQVIAGIAAGCELADCALVGGETAEMPGMYQEGEYDLAGFSVGIVEKNKMIHLTAVQPGNCLIGLASSGPHSNGYSLIRKIIELNSIDLNQEIENRPLGLALLEPTRIYVKSILSILSRYSIKAMAHITGGGFQENLPRVLPLDVKAQIQRNSWQWPSIFQWIQQQGQISEEEMLRTFNCGIGFVLCVENQDAEEIKNDLQAQGETCYFIGKIVKRDKNEPALEWI